MKSKAVIFDLFGTLVNSFPRPEYEIVLAKMSSLLSVPNDEFLRLWPILQNNGLPVFSRV